MSLLRIATVGIVLTLAGVSVATVAAATPPTPPMGSAPPVFAGSTAPEPIARLLANAWRTSPERAAALASVHAATARQQAASRPLYNPELALEAERAEVNTKTIGISQTVDLGGKRRLNRRAAQFEVRAAEADLVTTRQDFSAGLMMNLAHYQSSRALRTLAQRRTALMERFAQTASQRLAAGDIGPLDAALARVAYTNARIAEAGAERVLSQTTATLRAITGTVRSAWPELPGQLPQVVDNVSLPVLIDGLSTVQALNARAEAMAVVTRQFRRQRIPDPTVSLTGGREGADNLIGLSLSFPLPVLNSLRAEVVVASEEAVQARMQVAKEQRAAGARIEGALAAYAVVGAAWQDWLQNGEATLTEQVTLLQRLWDGGDLSASEFLLQAGQNVETRVAATQLAAEVWSAALELLHVTGSLDVWLMSGDIDRREGTDQ